mgnify:CR=1 FL=1
MDNEIIYTSAETQVKKLKSQKLTILNEEKAIRHLKTFGYSNIIKSYRDPYTINVDGKRVFRSGVSFEQICSLYILDKNLRNSVMASMQDLEEHIKEVAADILAQSFGVHQNEYLSYRNFRNKKKRKYCFTLPGILDTIKKAITTDKEPIHHYYSKYGMVPPWILFKSIYFSTIINFIDLFKNAEQSKMVSILYRDDLDISTENLCKLMMDTLYICLDYRNTSAHGGRIYNYNSASRLRSEEIFGDKSPSGINGFAKLLFLLSLFKYQSPYRRLNTALQHELTRHCNQFPEDITYLSRILNVDIVTYNAVYIGKKSNKYHSNPHCSGIENVKEISIEEAVQKGYCPCKRCCTDIPIV